MGSPRERLIGSCPSSLTKGMTWERQGRRNRYEIVPELPLRHPLVQERQVGELLEVLVGPWPPGSDQNGDAIKKTLAVPKPTLAP